MAARSKSTHGLAVANDELQGSVLVIGAGVIGLSTARVLQEQFPRLKLTIVADKFLDETLSHGAGGLFRPDATTSPGDDISIITTWVRNSFERFRTLALSPDAKDSGAQLVSGYHLSSVSQADCHNSMLATIVPDMTEVNPLELRTLFPEKFRFGCFYTTLIVDPRFYLRFLTKEFLRKNGNIVVRRIESIPSDPFLENYDVIVNCTGLQAKYLVGDFRLTPVRGQTIKVRAPWIKHFYYADGAYIIPLSDGIVTLGGIKEYGATNPIIDEHDRESIWRRCTALVPSLLKADRIQEWVGLRPFRQPVRVEMQIVDGHKIVHNYGHGGNGITLSWGTALHASSLVEQLLSNALRSKL